MGGGVADFLLEFAEDGVIGEFAGFDAAGGGFEEGGFGGFAVLADEDDVAVLVDGDDADGVGVFGDFADGAASGGEFYGVDADAEDATVVGAGGFDGVFVLDLGRLVGGWLGIGIRQDGFSYWPRMLNPRRRVRVPKK